MQALVSVRSVAEAIAVADAGVTLIDCKEPRAGALGALPRHRIARIVSALRDRKVELSATVGDAPANVGRAVEAVAACGVDRVKVGVASRSVLARLTELPRVVPVLIADAGIEDALVVAACRGFDTLMLDTADKGRGSLLDVVPLRSLQRAVAQAREHGRRIGLAGSLRIADLDRLHALQPDFAGFRSAVCAGDRGGTLARHRLNALVAALRQVAERAR